MGKDTLPTNVRPQTVDHMIKEEARVVAMAKEVMAKEALAKEAMAKEVLAKEVLAKEDMAKAKESVILLGRLLRSPN